MKNCNPLLLVTLAAAISLSTTSRSQAASIPWTENGVTWSTSGGTPTYYNPDASADAGFFDKLPSGAGTAPVWSNYSISGGVSTATVITNYLEISTNTLSTNSYSTNVGVNFSSLTFETRFRLDSINSPYYGNSIFMAANGKGLSLSFKANAIEQFGTVLVGGLDLTQWTVLRATITGGATPTLNLYINDSPVAAYTSSSIFYSSGNTLIGFGDASSSAEGGISQWDYLRWTNTGAYAPIPEPGTWALLTSVGLMILGWRRKRE